MARIRTIKPEFWRNEPLSKVSPLAALLAVGLLNHADDAGYFAANPGLVKADVFPLREISGSITVLLRELSDIGYIELFRGSDGRDYGCIVNFEKHQVINKPSRSKIKDLRTDEANSGSPTVVLPSGTGNREQGTGRGNTDTSSSPEASPQTETLNGATSTADDVRRVFAHWCSTWNHPRAKLDAKRSKVIRARMKDGYSVEDLCEAIAGFKHSDHHNGVKGKVFDQLDLLLRDAEHVDAGIRHGKNAGKFNPAEWI